MHLRIIEEETRILSAEDAAKADALLVEIAGSLTYGKLRSAVHRLVLELDPESAQRRKDAARRDAHVRPFREESGNAGMIGRELPSDEVLASWQHVEQRALDLRSAGVPGTLQELRVRAYLDLLQERDTRLDPAVPGPAGEPAASPEDTGEPGAQADDGIGPDGNDGPGHKPDGNDGGDDPAGTGTGRPSGPDHGPSLAALVTITIPWSSYTGRSGGPTEVGGFGVTDTADAHDLAAAAARDPRTRWCVTVLNPDGTAAAHGCAPGRHPPPGLYNLTVSSGPAPGPPRPLTPVPRTGSARWVSS